VARHNDREDFKKMLSDVSVSGDIVESQSKNLTDRIDLSSVMVKVSDSSIEGKGLFALSPICEGEIILPARLNGNRTQAGRYTNHSANPNAMMKASENGNIDLVAIKDIKGCQGGDSGEEITIDYRQAVSLTKQVGAICQQ